MRGKTVAYLRSALEACGYDFDVVFDKASRKRLYSDLRAVCWRIYQRELCRTSGQLSRAFHYPVNTIHYALVKAQTLMDTNRQFCDLYDTVYGYYMNAKLNAEYDSKRT